MPVNIAINGFGRIGRSIARALYENNHHHQLKLVAINELADIDGMAHLLKYDSAHGRFSQPVSIADQQLIIGNECVAVSHEHELENMPWHKHDVDIVLRLYWCIFN